MWLKASILFLVFNAAALNAVFAANQHRIVNGTDAKEAEYPFIISLRKAATGRHSCGGSLLNRAWVLTAAHCVARALPTMLNVQFGVTELKPGGADHVANVSKIFVHEGYEPYNKFIHDIALVKLSQLITFSDEVQAVRLPEAGQDTPANTSAILIGWGLNASGGQVQKRLQEVELQIFSDEECSERHQVQVHATNICAGVPEGGKGQCSGDSGGPLLVNGTQVGIVSWSRKPCAIAPFPGVFTQVAAYIDWILQTMGEEAARDDADGHAGGGVEEADEPVEQLMTGNLIVLQHAKPINLFKEASL